MSPGARKRWVLDTDVVLSALIRPGGTPGRLRLAWQAQLLVPLVSHDTAAELIRVLAYPKFKLTADEQHDLLADYLPWTQAVRGPNSAPKTPHCRDPHDVKFLQLAAFAKADALVTGDADLLVLAGAAPFAILKPTQALEHLSPV